MAPLISCHLPLMISSFMAILLLFWLLLGSRLFESLKLGGLGRGQLEIVVFFAIGHDSDVGKGQGDIISAHSQHLVETGDELISAPRFEGNVIHGGKLLLPRV